MDRARRRQDADKAYDIQLRAGTEGALRYGSTGLGLAILGHYTWPFFRRQTLAFKGFLVMGCSILGLSLYAESALQKLEAEQREHESIIRKEARIDLSRRGIVPTETAIAQWREARLREAAAAKPETSTE